MFLQMFFQQEKPREVAGLIFLIETCCYPVIKPGISEFRKCCEWNGTSLFVIAKDLLPCQFIDSEFVSLAVKPHTTKVACFL